MWMSEERDLLEEGRERLQVLLGESWSVTSSFPAPLDDLGLDDVWNLRRRTSDGGEESAQVIVEVKTKLPPLQANRLLDQLAALRRQADVFRPMLDQAVLVVAPWLSPRTRQ